MVFGSSSKTMVSDGLVFSGENHGYTEKPWYSAVVKNQKTTAPWFVQPLPGCTALHPGRVQPAPPRMQGSAPGAEPARCGVCNLTDMGVKAVVPSYLARKVVMQPWDCAYITNVGVAHPHI